MLISSCYIGIKEKVVYFRIHFFHEICKFDTRYGTVDIFPVRVRRGSDVTAVLLELYSGTSWSTVCLPASHWLLTQFRGEICSRFT